MHRILVNVLIGKDQVCIQNISDMFVFNNAWVGGWGGVDSPLPVVWVKGSRKVGFKKRKAFNARYLHNRQTLRSHEITYLTAMNSVRVQKQKKKKKKKQEKQAKRKKRRKEAAASGARRGSHTGRGVVGVYISGLFSCEQGQVVAASV